MAAACTDGGEAVADESAASSTGSATASESAAEEGAAAEAIPHQQRIEGLLTNARAGTIGLVVRNAEALPVDPTATGPGLRGFLELVGAPASEDAPNGTASALLVTPADPTAPSELLAVDAAGEPIGDGSNGNGADGDGPDSTGSDGEDDGTDGPLDRFLPALAVDADLSFLHLLETGGSGTATATTTLADAAAVSGAFDVVDGRLVGSLVFHTPDAADFVDAYNLLNRPATQGDDPPEQPVTVSEPIVSGLDQVIVPLPPFPVDGSLEDTTQVRNVIKKLSVGMEALTYANAVGARSEPAWLDFVVKSQASDEQPTPAGSVYIRWEFRDQAAIEEFERNELPAGFRLAPTRFLESDAPEGEIFFALNLYDAAGGSVVGGARAEWDVFVHGPDGADPNAGVRPRFAVVEALAEQVSADATNLLTTSEPLSYGLNNGMVVSSVGRFDGNGSPIPVFESSFPVPVPGEAPVARFTREMAIGNDYIYWGHGVSDRVLYNATTFNHDAHFVDVSQLTYTDLSPWARYLKPEVKDAVYYQNTLEYVVTPMANLVTSEHLDITPEWREELIRFTTNGHQDGLMQGAVQGLFAGTADPFVGREIGNGVPAGHYLFEVTDPAELQAQLDLAPGRRLAPISLFVDDDPRHYLSVTIYEFDDGPEGVRAEFAVYTTVDEAPADDDGGAADPTRPPDRTIITTLTGRPTIDPITIFRRPGAITHTLDGETLTTRLGSPDVRFAATITTTDPTERPLHLDWIEAGDDTCHRNGVCDRYYYDAEALDVPVKVPASFTIDELSTPWDRFLSSEPAAVFFRDNFQQYAIKPWYNLDVVLPPLPFSGVDDATHALDGTGTLVGRTNDIVDSEYRYSGDARLEGDVLVFALDQQIDNALGTAHIYTTGRFDLETGTGTQTVINCDGDPLLCSDIDSGSTSLYAVQDLAIGGGDGPNDLSWQLNAALDLGGTFGVADSTSTIVASAITAG